MLKLKKKNKRTILGKKDQNEIERKKNSHNATLIEILFLESFFFGIEQNIEFSNKHYYGESKKNRKCRDQCIILPFDLKFLKDRKTNLRILRNDNVWKVEVNVSIFREFWVNFFFKNLNSNGNTIFVHLSFSEFKVKD